MGGPFPWPCFGPAIALYHSCYNIIEDNYIPLFMSALILRNGSDGNIITNNTLYSRVASDSSNNTFTRNNIGIITFYNSLNNILTRNDILQIKFDNSFNARITDNNFLKYSFKDWKEYGPQAQFINSDILFDHNYWGKSRLLPKIIFGTKTVNDRTRHAIEFDWHPAQQPYAVPIKDY
jgi:hypothetical protein